MTDHTRQREVLEERLLVWQKQDRMGGRCLCGGLPVDERPCRTCLAPALTRSLVAMSKASEALLAVVNESTGIIGWHLNGAVAEWDEFDFIEQLEAALSTMPEVKA